MLKIDGAGEIAWQKVYGQLSRASAIRLTADGGYIVAGDTWSLGAGKDLWVLKLDTGGNIVWQKTYGGANDDAAYSVQPTADSGYVVAGRTSSFGAGSGDAWVLKLDAGGNIVWEKTYGGTNSDIASSVQPTSDGGYVVAGWTTSFGAGSDDAWVLKLDAGGNVVWQKSYGGPSSDAAYSVQPIGDGGYVVAGSINYAGPSSGDGWVLKLDAGGNIAWQRIYVSTNSDALNSVQSTSDGGYVAAGYTHSSDANPLDALVLKLDANGTSAGCAFMGDSHATAADSSAITADSTAAIADTTIAPVSGTLITGNSTAVTHRQCSLRDWYRHTYPLRMGSGYRVGHPSVYRAQH